MKTVTAVHDFEPVNPETDLPLVRCEEYQVISESIDGCPGWWRVKNKFGDVGLIPSNYVEEKHPSAPEPSSSASPKNLGSSSSSSGVKRRESSSGGNRSSSNSHHLNSCHWFLPEIDRESAESILRADGREGVFLVRYSSSQELFTISVLVRSSSRHFEVKHYLIRKSENNNNQSGDTCYYLSEHHRFSSVEELIHYHRHDAGSLAVRLKFVPSFSNSSSPSSKNSNQRLSKLCGDKSWEIRVSELSLLEELGSGQFGVVRRGKWTRVVSVDEGNSHHPESASSAGAASSCHVAMRRKTVSVDVAVKLMKEGTMSEADFVREAKVMTKLRHPHLVQLFGLCIEHRPICIVTEFMKHGECTLQVIIHNIILDTHDNKPSQVASHSNHNQEEQSLFQVCVACLSLTHYDLSSLISDMSFGEAALPD